MVRFISQRATFPYEVTVRFILWAIVFVVAVLLLMVPFVYVQTSRQMLPLETEFEVQKIVKSEVESDRKAILRPVPDFENTDVTFAKPDLKVLPDLLVRSYVMGFGCPNYLTSTRETDWEWLLRLAAASQDTARPGDGACELLFARNLATHLQAGSKETSLLAAWRMRSYFKREDLLAYELEATQFLPGVWGPRDAARALYHRDLKTLTPGEIAEFQLAFPPFNNWSEILTCKNVLLIRQGRDSVLTAWVQAGLMSEADAQVAMKQKLACETRK